MKINFNKYKTKTTLQQLEDCTIGDYVWANGQLVIILEKVNSYGKDWFKVYEFTDEKIVLCPTHLSCCKISKDRIHISIDY